MIKIKYNIVLFSLISLVTLGVLSCKEQEVIGEDPYKGGKESLGIAFVGDYSDPESGRPGTEVTFGVKGLKNFEGEYTFHINEQLAEIKRSTDSTITVIIPSNVSSGGASIRAKGQVFFGPRFEVEGKVSEDKNYQIVNGTNYPVADAIKINGDIIFVGSFTNFENQATNAKPINNIVATTSTGALQTSYNFGRGGNGNLNSIVKLSDNQLVVAGSFSSFNKHEGILGITKLWSDGRLDTTVVEVINLSTAPEDEKDGLDTVPSFNGGVYGSVNKVYVQNIGGVEKIIALGNFTQYGQYYYARATKDFKPVDISQVRNVIRMDLHGNLDSTYAFNTASNTFYPAANGFIQAGHLNSAQQLIVVGSFTTFQGKPASRIVRLTPSGVVDESFNAGTGANGSISGIQYDATSNTYMLIGQFTQYNGVNANGIARIKSDGSLDDTFKPKLIEGGAPTFAKQLSNGKIVVAGTFEKYDQVVRRGLLILESDGSLIQEYNSFGAFQGMVNNVIESTSSNGLPAIILYGYITKYNDKVAHNILKLEIAN